MKNMTWKLVPALFNFQRIFCKRESEEASMLIRTNFDSFAITYLIAVTYLIQVDYFKNFISQ